MGKRKKTTAIQPSLFEMQDVSATSQDSGDRAIQREPLPPGDVCFVGGDRSRYWFVCQVIADHAVIFNETDLDTVPLVDCERLGRMSPLLKGFVQGWLTNLVGAAGYWEVLRLLSELQPTTARIGDPMRILMVSFATEQARYQEVWKVYESDLEAVEPLVDWFLERCRDDELPYEQALAAVYKRYFEGGDRD